jgi:hypothetical protein
MQTSGQGIVLTGLDPSGSAPDPRWRCSEVVAGAVAHLVATTPLDDLVDTFLRAGRRVRALAELVNTPLVSDRITRAG